jgi:hypothetical protein
MLYWQCTAGWPVTLTDGTSNKESSVTVVKKSSMLTKSHSRPHAPVSKLRYKQGPVPCRRITRQPQRHVPTDPQFPVTPLQTLYDCAVPLELRRGSLVHGKGAKTIAS